MNAVVWIRATSTAAAAAFLAFGIANAAMPDTGRSSRSGDDVLAGAVSAAGLRSYAVPITLAVHMREPIDARSSVDGSVYFQAPANSALIISHATGLLGMFFKGKYQLDLVPQVWPRNYHVTSVGQAVVNGVSVLQLQAMPRAGAANIARIIFTLDLAERRPIGAEWSYTDGSSIRLSYVNGRTGSYILPQRASVSVDMPSNKLDAEATYGSYDLNASLPDDVFHT